MEANSAANHNPTKRRGRKRRRTPEAPCPDCILRASQSIGKGNVSFCNDCARALGHGLPELSINVQTMNNRPGRRGGIRKHDLRRRATANSVASALAASRSPELLAQNARLSRERLPILPSAFTSLKQAFDMLHRVEGRLARLIVDIERSDQAISTPPSQDLFRQQCRPWLDTWEKAFARYLAVNVANMTEEQLKAAMTLKAHQLIDETFAAVQLKEGQLDWSIFNRQFTAVLNLAAEVVKEVSMPPPSTNTINKYQSILPDIGIHDPVFEVKIRTTHQTLLNRATHLLTIINPRHGRLNTTQLVQEDDLQQLLQDDTSLLLVSTTPFDDTLPAISFPP